MTSKTNVPGSGKYSRRILWISIISILAIAGGYYYYTSKVPASETSTTSEMQTAIVRQGDLVIYASGTGTLVSNSEASFGFSTSGQVTQVYAKVGDKVEAGQVLAELNNTSLLLNYEQAKRELAELTSPSAIATAQQNVALAEDDLATKKKNLEYLISPAVLAWEERLAEAQDVLARAQAEAGANPSDAAQQKVKEAEQAVKYAEANLKLAQAAYPDYVKANFTETTTDPRTGEKRIKYYYDDEGNKYTVIYAPTQAEIDAARAAYALAKATLAEAKYYLAALKGEEIPADATGSALYTFQKARDALTSAQEALAETQLAAPISGTVMTLDFHVGDVVNSSTSTVTIVNLDEPCIEVFLDESDWTNISVGYETEVTFDILPEKIFKGEVIQVDPGLYTSGNTSVVRALVKLDPTDSFNLPLGTSASVDVIGGRAENAVLVPVEALHETNPGEYAVFVVEDGKPRLRVIEVGIQDLLYAEVKSGLNPGDVVTTGITETQ
jgi:RND family efflux transporter MFP subunit